MAPFRPLSRLSSRFDTLRDSRRALERAQLFMTRLDHCLHFILQVFALQASMMNNTRTRTRGGHGGLRARLPRSPVPVCEDNATPSRSFLLVLDDFADWPLAAPTPTPTLLASKQRCCSLLLVRLLRFSVVSPFLFFFMDAMQRGWQWLP